jgi:hypothetical protein
VLSEFGWRRDRAAADDPLTLLATSQQKTAKFRTLTLQPINEGPGSPIAALPGEPKNHNLAVLAMLWGTFHLELIAMLNDVVRHYRPLDSVFE